MHHNFIAIEGNIGAGKTTLAGRIAADFNARLILEQFEENAFLPKFYVEPEKYAFPLEMSFLASRYQQLKDQLGTQDLFKSFTISDYFIIKSLIFAMKTLTQDEFNLYNRFFSIIYSQLPKPNLFVYLHLSIDRLQLNIRQRGRPYEQNISNDYLEKIQEGYFDYMRDQSASMRILIIDTNKLDFLLFKDHYQQIVDIINRQYDIGIHRFTF